MYRFDRDVSTSNSLRGGGVLIAVNSNLKSDLISSISCLIDHLFVRIQACSLVNIIGVFYIPPNSTEPICEARPGSFRTHVEISSLFSDTLNFIDLRQINFTLNHHGSLLDLIFCNFSAYTLNPLMQIQCYQLIIIIHYYI